MYLGHWQIGFRVFQGFQLIKKQTWFQTSFVFQEILLQPSLSSAFHIQVFFSGWAWLQSW